MKEQAYVLRNLRKSVSYRNLIKVEEFKTEERLNEACLAALELMNSEQVWKDAITTRKLLGKPIHIVTKPESILLHNLLVSNLKKCYGVEATDREQTIRLLLSCLQEAHNFQIHRLDLKSFYESFDVSYVRNKIKSDSIVSKKTLNLLTKLFVELKSLSVSGLPRGMGISAVLSEIMMQQFDEYLESKREVLFYSRFVDDIIIISSPNMNRMKLEEYLSSAPLSKGLEFHKSGDKVTHELIGKTSFSEGKSTTFDFLGYEFDVTQNEVKSGKTFDVSLRKVDTRVADKKVMKIKKRIIQSFACYLKDKGDENVRKALLIKRIKFLSRNYELPSKKDRDRIYSGIFYNYKVASDSSNLAELDLFYKSLLFGSRTSMSKRIKSKLNYSERLKLSRISFKDGFDERLFCRFSYSDLLEIKKAWY